MKCGTILHDKTFQFSDTGVSDKLIIVLCEAGTDHLVVTTTSKQHSRNQTAGCQISDKLPNFFVRSRAPWFDVDTWIELGEVHSIPGYILDAKIADGTITVYENVLTDVFVRDLLDCVLQSDDIDGFELDLIRAARQKL